MLKTLLKARFGLALIAASFVLHNTFGLAAFLALIPLAALLHLWRDGQPRSRRHTLEIFLLYFLVIGYGVGSLYRFVGHIYYGDQVAAATGWAASPFQLELAAYDLAFGIIGILAWWLRGQWWTALAVGKSIFLFGTAAIRVQAIIASDAITFANANFESLYLGGLILPTLVLGLLIVYKFDGAALLPISIPDRRIPTTSFTR